MFKVPYRLDSIVGMEVLHVRDFLLPLGTTF